MLAASMDPMDELRPGGGLDTPPLLSFDLTPLTCGGEGAEPWAEWRSLETGDALDFASLPSFFFPKRNDIFASPFRSGAQPPRPAMWEVAEAVRLAGSISPSAPHEAVGGAYTGDAGPPNESAKLRRTATLFASGRGRGGAKVRRGGWVARAGTGGRRSWLQAP